jgi:aspartyl-tRNA(Asn)/glutamyl-tRNA(Gln) amidotransferase subunit A
VGLKPTQGAVDARGAMPLAPSLDCVGPIAANAGDCQALFEALVLGDPRFAPAAQPLSLRFAFPLAALSREVPAEILGPLEAAAEVFRGLGHAVADAPLPDIARLHRLADVIQRPESLSSHAETLAARRGDYTAHVRRRIEGGLFIGAAAYVQALRQRPAHRQALLDTAFARADILLLPSVGTPTPRIDDTDEARAGAIPELVARMTRWTRWLNYLGLPALSLPCGRDTAGLPVGLQLVAPPFRERDLFAAARRFEAAAPDLVWAGGPDFQE